METLKFVMEVFSALLTPVIGAIVAYIAWQQYRLEKRNARHALLDRRLNVFRSTMTFFSEIRGSARPNQNSCFQFLRDTSDAFYLFKPNIKSYLEEVYKKAIELEYTQKALDSEHLPVGERRTELADKSLKLLEWFSQQFEECPTKFSEYLNVSDN